MCAPLERIALLHLTHQELIVPSGSGAQSWQKSLGWSHSLHFWFASQKCLQWAKGRSRSHNLSSLPLLGELFLLMSAHVSLSRRRLWEAWPSPSAVCSFIVQQWGISPSRIPSQAIQSRTSRSWLLGFKYQISTKGIRKEDQNKSAWCLLFTAQAFLSKPGGWREKAHLLAAY